MHESTTQDRGRAEPISLRVERTAGEKSFPTMLGIALIGAIVIGVVVAAIVLPGI